jgi:hypothetical protein
MQLTAKLIQILPVEKGMGKNGEWKKQNIIVETDGQYAKKICITVWGDKIDPVRLQPNNMLTIDFDIESREFNGRWYTDVKAWKVELSGAPQEVKFPEPLSDSVSDFSLTPPAPSFDDLPF